MELISFAIFGLVVGLIARFLHPGRDPMGLLWTMVLGMVGAVVGGWIGMAAGFRADQGVMSWVVAIVGSILVLMVYYGITARRAAEPRRF